MTPTTVKAIRAARFVAAFGAAAACFGAASAQAGDFVVDGVARTVVKYPDLNLARDADARTLYTRLQFAARNVCSEFVGVRDLRMKQVYEACYQDTLERAVDNVGHANVKAIFQADERIRLAARSSRSQAAT